MGVLFLLIIIVVIIIFIAKSSNSNPNVRPLHQQTLFIDDMKKVARTFKSGGPKNHERITLAVKAACNRMAMGVIEDDLFNEVKEYLNPCQKILGLIIDYHGFKSDKHNAMSEDLEKILDKLADTVEELMDGKIELKTSREIRTHANEMADQQKTEFEELKRKINKAEQQYMSKLVTNQLVRHRVFGLGKIKELINTGEDTIIVVKFNTGQTKSMILKYAHLTEP